jgi:hypothetical protein
MSQPEQAVAGGAAGLQRSGIQQRADVRQRLPEAVVWPPPIRAVPASAASRPRMTRIVVDFPVPFGPTKPVTTMAGDGAARLIIENGGDILDPVLRRGRPRPRPARHPWRRPLPDDHLPRPAGHGADADRGRAPEDRVSGLSLGADDYLAKPFHFPWPVLRIRALARRASPVCLDRLNVVDVRRSRVIQLGAVLPDRPGPRHAGSRSLGKRLSLWD